ncbi:MG2 domain protein [Mariniflexile rhizosphaerae]|uniref:TonB-dependent receptor n=1 Tax=unclassified Mariniflexile TaxID=2643887 RepID=UPI000CBD0609|nr:Plug domain-containing protein [Mariniflexile sp. TRM1-10]AXP79905.1 MG2 domain protein [Mariniflexile sp. TRM1-10]PLB21092.1 MAG: TonB-dependent receptor plug [Flavobacteriaceae bacterium FS1-H7996/R]
MFESFNRNYRSLYFLLTLLTFVSLHAQDKKTAYDIEKIYLHTDRSRYFMGEDLWYKAYNVDVYNNLLSNHSNVLYVELISPDSNIIARNKTNLEMGLGHGDFKLTDSVGVKPGVYQIRAYTNWNRNFGEDFVFKKNVEIIDIFDAHFNPNKLQVTPTNGVISETHKQNIFKIDFFPEGGSLLKNVASVVGFKAVGSNGNPINVEGEVYDSDNELVTSFTSVHDGMGQFQMIPISGKQYYVKIRTQSGIELRKTLPKALDQGYLLSFKIFKGRNIISINTNQETLKQVSNHELTLVCKSKGVTYLESQLNLRETTLSFELSKAKIPEGINQITLYDSKNRPQSERLVYVEKEHDLEVSLETDKTSYKPNEKVNINVTSKSKSGATKSASYSLSVTDMNGVENNIDYGTTISSYFLMESDIRGQVHHPSYYFTPENSKRLEHLDNLLLTQGWRDFIWKTLQKPKDSMIYKVEKGFTISGRTKQVFGKKPLINNHVTLALMNGKNFNAFSTTTDTLGGFKFEDLLFSGKTNLQLNSRNEKGKFSGKILLDSIEQPPMKASFKSKSRSLPKEEGVVDHVYKKYINFGIQPENVLDEVEIVGKKRNDIVVFHGLVDNSYIADEETKTYADIYQLIQQKIPGVTLSSDGNGVVARYPYGRYILFFNRYATEPIILIDGFPIVDKTQFEDVDPDEIEKIEAIRGAQAMAYYGEESSSGLIAIYTNRHLGNKPKKDAISTVKKEIEGFYEARTFYVPNPEKNNLEADKKTEARNTIYWTPYLHPDKKGLANVSYYNAGVETKVKVALEGITSSGTPVVKNTYYTIRK